MHAAVLLVLAGCDDPIVPGVSGSHPQGIVAAVDSLGFRPFGIAVNRGGTVYVTQLDHASLSSGSVTTLALGSGITVGNTPTAVAFGPSGATAYVTNQLSSSVGVVDVASGSQVDQVPVTGNTFNVITSRDGANVFVTTNTNQVHRINANTRTVTGSVSVGVGPNALVFGKGDTLLYVSAFVSGTIYEIDVNGPMSVTRVFPTGGSPQGMAISSARDRLYIADQTGALNVLDLATGGVTSPIKFADGAFGLALSPDQAQLYLTLLGGGVVVIDRATLTVVKTIPVGTQPRRVAFSADGETAVVADQGGAVIFIR